MGAEVCANCHSILRRGRSFAFKTPLGEAVKCASCALRHKPMLRRSLYTALVVGTILTLLNQGNLVLSGSWATPLYWKVPLTYCTPFLVATWGALINNRR
jgi:hypothetical protein